MSLLCSLVSSSTWLFHTFSTQSTDSPIESHPISTHLPASVPTLWLGSWSVPTDELFMLLSKASHSSKSPLCLPSPVLFFAVSWIIPISVQICCYFSHLKQKFYLYKLLIKILKISVQNSIIGCCHSSKTKCKCGQVAIFLYAIAMFTYYTYMCKYMDFLILKMERKTKKWIQMVSLRGMQQVEGAETEARIH